jgi:UDPglucose--hexose-1-phosphate uridylyltransferase
LTFPLNPRNNAAVTNPALWRTSARLADGREIIYYDESPDRPRVLSDPRDLPEVSNLSEIRYDALLHEWVGVAGHRLARTYHPPTNQCPLCPSTPEQATEIPSPSYDVVVFENRFPSFAGTGPSGGAWWPPDITGADGVRQPKGTAPLDALLPGRGRCEVVCFTSDHNATMSVLPPARIRTVVEAWIDRTTELSGLDGVEQVFCFENRGTEIGVTLAHPHGQIYGYPFVTPFTTAMLESVQAHRTATGRNLFADIVAAETAGERVVAANEHWLAFVPFAARWPIEVHLYPRRQVPDLPSLTGDERDALVPIYLEVLHRMEGVFDDTLPSITAWHQAPLHVGRDDFWLHLRLFSIRREVGKLKYLAGSESGMGAWVNDISPEQAASRLREVELP